VLSPTTCYHQPPAITNHPLSPTTCYHQPPVITNHLLSPTTNDHHPLMIIKLFILNGEHTIYTVKIAMPRRNDDTMST
jgi:hypothetical protein